MDSSAEQEVLDAVPDGLLVGGRWRAAESAATLEVQDPATGTVMATRKIAPAVAAGCTAVVNRLS